MLKTALSYSLILSMIMMAVCSCNKDEDESSSDTTAPVITILPPNPIFTQKDSVYNDPGATAVDDVDGDISANIVTTSNVNVNVVGDYTVNYKVADRAGNLADTFRVVKVMIFN
jgi:hypothetical protein